MGKTLADLALGLERRVQDVEKNASELAVKVADGVIQSVMLATRVDTSNALSNWQVKLNDRIPSTAEISPHFLGSKGSTTSASFGAAHREAMTVLRGKKPSDTIFISNVTPYIGKIDPGFTDIARLKAQLVMKNG